MAYTIHFFTNDTTYISASYTLPGYLMAEQWALTKLANSPAYMLAEIWQAGVFVKALAKA